MYQTDDADDLNELLSAARTLSDKLEVLAHSQRIQFFGIVAGLYISVLLILGVLTSVFSYRDPFIKYTSEINQISPMIIVALVYALAKFSQTFYRLSVDKKYVFLARQRIEEEMIEARRFILSS